MLYTLGFRQWRAALRMSPRRVGPGVLGVTGGASSAMLPALNGLSSSSSAALLLRGLPSCGSSAGRWPRAVGISASASANASAPATDSCIAPTCGAFLVCDNHMGLAGICCPSSLFFPAHQLLTECSVRATGCPDVLRCVLFPPVWRVKLLLAFQRVRGTTSPARACSRVGQSGCANWDF